MKLLRYGPAGQEKPGLLDSNNQIRDLSGIVPDIAGRRLLPDALDRLRRLDPATLPVVNGTPRIGPCVGQVGKFICVGLNYSDHAAESGMAVPNEPILFMKATSSIVGPRRRHRAAARVAEDRLGSRARRRDRQAGEVRQRSRCPGARCRLLRRPRRLGARVSARGHGAVGQGQERRHVWSDRAVARDGRRSAGSGQPGTVARRRRHAAARTARRRR